MINKYLVIFSGLLVQLTMSPPSIAEADIHMYSGRNCAERYIDKVPQRIVEGSNIDKASAHYVMCPVPHNYHKTQTIQILVYVVDTSAERSLSCELKSRFVGRKGQEYTPPLSERVADQPESNDYHYTLAFTFGGTSTDNYAVHKLLCLLPPQNERGTPGIVGYSLYED
jgi:hypothetical protein